MTIAIQDQQSTIKNVDVPAIAMSGFDSDPIPTLRSVKVGKTDVAVHGKLWAFNGSNGYPAELHIEWYPRFRDGVATRHFAVRLTKTITEIVDDVRLRQGKVHTGLTLEVPDWGGLTDLTGLKNQIGNLYTTTFDSGALVSGAPGLTILQQWMNTILTVKSS